MRDTRTTAEMVLARLRADAPSDTRGVDGEQARRRPTAPGGKQARRPTAPGGKQALRHQDRVPESEGTVNPGG